MIVRALLAGAAFAAGLAASAPASAPDKTDAVRRSYYQNFKDEALALCVAKAYRAEPIASADATALAGGFGEWGNHDVEHDTGKVPALIDRYLARSYGSFQGPSVRLDFMKCMDMNRGPELDNLARRYVIHPQRSYAKDHPDGRR